MNKLFRNPHLGLFAATLAIVVAALTTGCDVAQAKSLAAGPGAPRGQQKPKYFGDEFAQAQQALKDKPAAEMPQAF